MDLIDKMSAILKDIGLKAPTIDLHYDNQNNVMGYLTDESFKIKSDNESQSIIWNALKKRLEPDELLRIIALFHETPQERVERLNGYKSQEVQFSKFWFHQTPELSKYWLFIDVAKIDEEFKSFYLIINEKDNINKGLTFVYNKEVLDFMELEQNEIHDEIFSNTFNNAIAEIKMDLINKYEKLTEQQLFGKANLYWYVYGDFQMSQISKNQLFFSEKEINMIKEGLANIIDDFTVKRDLQKAMNVSSIINNAKSEQMTLSTNVQRA